MNELKNLKELFLFINKISIIPDGLSKLKKLEFLAIGDNNISKIPKEIKNLINLHTLGIYNNKITELPEDFNKLINLEELWIYNNLFLEYPPKIILDLPKLNKIKITPYSFISKEKLMIEIDKNKIRTQNNNVNQDEELCCICMENKKEAAIVPCGHVICWDNLCRNMLNGKCPICKNKIDKIIKIYI